MDRVYDTMACNFPREKFNRLQVAFEIFASFFLVGRTNIFPTEANPNDTCIIDTKVNVCCLGQIGICQASSLMDTSLAIHLSLLLWDGMV